MNKLVENKLRKLIQKEIKSVLKENDGPSLINFIEEGGTEIQDMHGLIEDLKEKLNKNSNLDSEIKKDVLNELDTIWESLNIIILKLKISY